MPKNKLLLINLAIAAIVIILIVGAFWAIQSSLNESPKTLSQNGDSAISEEQEQAASNIPDELKVREGDHIWGDRSAPVQLVVYADFECPFCLEFYDTLEKAKEEFNGQIAVVFRHYPLRSHMNAIPAAQAAECAGEQDKFWEMYSRLYEDNRNNTLYPEQFPIDAESLGIDVNQFNDCYNSNRYLEKIVKDMEGVKQFGVIGAPAFFVNGIVYPGASPMEDYTDEAGQNVLGLRSIIKAALKDK